MTVISHLALNDVIKIKGEVVDICLLLEENDVKTKDLVKLFFHEMDKKGDNYIYNMIPQALTRISNDYTSLEYEKFKSVVKILLSYIKKDKQTEGLIEKLVGKLKDNTHIEEWRCTTYCLSLLNFSEKTITLFIEMFSTLKEQLLDDAIIKDNFVNLFSKYRRSAACNPAMIEEIEKRFLNGQKVTSIKEKMKRENKRLENNQEPAKKVSKTKQNKVKVIDEEDEEGEFVEESDLSDSLLSEDEESIEEEDGDE